MLVEAELGLAVRIDQHAPACAVLARVDIRRHVFHRRGIHRRTRARIQTADENGRGGDFFLGGVQAAGQLGHVVARQEFQFLLHDLQGKLAMRRARIELFKLRAQAVGQIDAGHAGRIETLQLAAHRFHFFGGGLQMGRQRGEHRVDAFAEVTIGIERVDQHGGDRLGARLHRREVELPQQVFLQGFGRRVLRLHAIFVAVAGTAVAAAVAGGEIDRLVGADFRLGPLRRFVVGVAGGGGATVEGVQRFEFVVVLAVGFGFVLLQRGVFGKFQQRVALGELAQLGRQLQLRQLQKADGLLQLRRKSQLLIETELKPWFHACQTGLA